MPKTYVVRPVEVEVWTFEEFVEYGDKHATVRDSNGVPLGFEFSGKTITRENDYTYIVPVKFDGGEGLVPFFNGNLLIVAADGWLYPCSPELVEKTYAPKETA